LMRSVGQRFPESSRPATTPVRRCRRWPRRSRQVRSRLRRLCRVWPRTRPTDTGMDGTTVNGELNKHADEDECDVLHLQRAWWLSPEWRLPGQCTPIPTPISPTNSTRMASTGRRITGARVPSTSIAISAGAGRRTKAHCLRSEIPKRPNNWPRERSRLRDNASNHEPIAPLPPAQL
jgi:hypothetical protein